MDLNALDVKLYFLINHGTINGLFDVIMPFLSNKGYLLALPFGAYMILQAFRQPAEKRQETIILALWTIAVAIVSFLLADWIGNELKHYIERIRPCHVLDGARLLGGCSESFSMPSNHAINSFAYAVPLFFMTRGYIGRVWRFYPLILAALVAYSRPYLGVHYPGDVMIGAILGILSAAINITFFRLASSKYKERPCTTLLYSSLFIIAIFRIYYLLRGPLDLSPAEAGYWQQSITGMHTALLSASPLVIWLISLGTAIFGDTVFGVRIFASALSLMASYLMFRLVYEIYQDEAAALGSALLVQAIPIFSLSGIIMAPESLLVFFWILSLGLLYESINEHRDNPVSSKSKLSIAWVMLGVSIGLGLLTSLTMALFLIGMYLFLLMSDKKYLLKTIKPHASIIISIAILLAGRAFAGLNSALPQPNTFSVIQNIIDSAGWHLLMITPIILVLIFFSLHQLFYKEYGRPSVFLFAFSIPVLVLSFIGNILCNPDRGWGMVGYITGIIAMACYFFRTGKGELESTKTKNVKRVIIGVGIAIALAVTAILHFPMMIKMPASSDPTIERRGWKDLGREVSAIIGQQGNSSLPVIYSEDCRIASELAFYINKHPKTYCSGPLGKYASKGTNAVFVIEGDAVLPEKVSRLFEKTEKKVVRITFKGTELKAYSVFICYNSKGPEMGLIER